MRQISRHGVVYLVSLIANTLVFACSTFGPSETGTVVAIVIADGQTYRFTDAGNASGASRRPTNPAWPHGLVDLSLSNCDGDRAVTMNLYEASPTPGRYDVSSEANQGVEARLLFRSGEEWSAGSFARGSSGSITVSSSSPTRISGSYAFVLVQRNTGGGGPVPLPPPTKPIEGTFDLEINDKVRCP
jgi:hypothetical protein